MQITSEHHSHLQRKILEAMVAGLRTDAIKGHQVPEIAEFVLDKMPDITTEKRLEQFKKELAERWPISVNALHVN